MGDPEKSTVLMGVYNAVRDNLEFYKRQQWLMIYYALLAYAAIFVAYQYLKDYKFCMFVFGGIIFIISCLVILVFQVSLHNERQMVEKIKEKLPLLNEISKEQKESVAFLVPFLMVAINALGYFFLVFVICKK